MFVCAIKFSCRNSSGRSTLTYSCDRPRRVGLATVVGASEVSDNVL